MKIAATGGGVGDIIYSIPTLKKLEVDVLYIKEAFYPDGSSMFSILRTLMELQGFRVLPTSGAFPHYHYQPGLQFDYDLDACKRDPHMRGVLHIMESYLNYYKLPFKGYTMFDPWLINIPNNKNFSNGEAYSTWMVTQRWREWTTHKWKETWRRVSGGRKVFFGFEEDHEWFQKEVDDSVELYKTKDVLEIASIMKTSTTHFCNQNFSLPLALGMGIEHYVEFKPRKTNCISYRDYEHILNEQDQ